MVCSCWPNLGGSHLLGAKGSHLSTVSWEMFRGSFQTQSPTATNWNISGGSTYPKHVQLFVKEHLKNVLGNRQPKIKDVCKINPPQPVMRFQLSARQCSSISDSQRWGKSWHVKVFSVNSYCDLPNWPPSNGCVAPNLEEQSMHHDHYMMFPWTPSIYINLWGFLS